MECLVTLAKTYNRTVVFTIHQPRSNIVALFDRLILLAKGKTVYSGPFSSCQRYFDNIGYSCPPGFNIADYLVDLTMHASVARSPVDEEPLGLNVQTDHLKTASSSLRAVKSIASASNASIDEMARTPQETIVRPKSKRQQSLKQRQDRQLYTRKKGVDTPPTPRTDEEDNNLESVAEGNPQWLRLSRQQPAAQPQIPDDPDQLPPAASGMGTDLDVLVANYAASDVARSVHDEIVTAVQSALAANGSANADQLSGHSTTYQVKGYARVGLLRQFVILSQRTWRNLYRNPMLMLTHYAISILLAVLCGYLFYGLTDDIKGFQNRLGLFFFILALFGFSTLTSLTVFSSERLLFVRERANGYYSPITYFAAKVIFDIVPLRLIPPIIMGVIVYPMTGLVPAWPEFLRFLLILVLFNLAAAGICLFIGIVFRDAGVANLIGSLVMLFSLLFAGLLLNHDAIPKAALWMQTVRFILFLNCDEVMANVSAALDLPLWIRGTDRERGDLPDIDRPQVRSGHRGAWRLDPERVRLRHVGLVERRDWSGGHLGSVHRDRLCGDARASRGEEVILRSVCTTFFTGFLRFPLFFYVFWGMTCTTSIPYLLGVLWFRRRTGRLSL